MRPPLSITYKGKTESIIRGFPPPVVERFAYDLEAISYGQKPASSSKQMNGFSKNVIELRKNGKPAYRLIYTIIGDTIFVIHAFVKSSVGTDKKHESTIKLRLSSL